MPNHSQYITFTRPGYVQTKFETMTLIPNPDNASESLTTLLRNSAAEGALVPGEWLEEDATWDTRNNTPRVRRGGDGACAVAGTPDDEYTGDQRLRMSSIEAPRHPMLQASGRSMIEVLELQAPGTQIITNVCCSEGCVRGSYLSVWDYDGNAGAWGTVRRALALAVDDAAVCVARVVRVISTDVMEVEILSAPIRKVNT